MGSVNSEIIGYPSVRMKKEAETISCYQPQILIERIFALFLLV
jgi:hypothetical protein